MTLRNAAPYQEYLAAYAIDHDPFPGINAATLSLLLGDRAAAERLAVPGGVAEIPEEAGGHPGGEGDLPLPAQRKPVGHREGGISIARML